MKIIQFDKEYSTQWSTEYAFLKQRGIPYTFVKVDDRGITTWKYAKTAELFSALSDFYAQSNEAK